MNLVGIAVAKHRVPVRIMVLRGLRSLKKKMVTRRVVLSRADLRCATSHTDLLKLRSLYNIPEDVLLTISGKCDIPSRPPKGYVTLHMENFKLGARLPLQPYFARILGGMHLAPGQLHPNRWRVLSALFVLWERCQLGEPFLVEIKNLYQLRSSPKEAG